jgi:hypothetical protein
MVKTTNQHGSFGYLLTFWVSVGTCENGGNCRAISAGTQDAHGFPAKNVTPWHGENSATVADPLSTFRNGVI